MSTMVRIPWGTTAPIRFALTDSAGAARDLTGETVRIQIRPARSVHQPVLVTKTSTDSEEIDIPDPEDGVCYLYIAAADWSSLREGTIYAFGIGITNALGEWLVPEAGGQMEVQQSAVSPP